MALQQLPTVIIDHENDESKYQEIVEILNRDFLDVSIILNQAPNDINRSFYWIICTEQELIKCLNQYPKAVPIGYKLLLRCIKTYQSKKSLMDNKKSQTLQYLMHHTQHLFDKLVICTSGIHNNTKNDIKTIVSHLNGKYDGNFTDIVTHLIETNIGSPKHYAAAQSGGKCQIATPQWIYDCYLYGKVHETAKYCPPLFTQFYLSVTGIDSTEREQIKKWVKYYGGEYCQGLSQQCTHLIAANQQCLNNEKCKAAKTWNIPILKKEWFYAYLKSKGCTNINDYRWDKDNHRDRDDHPFKMSGNRRNNTGFALNRGVTNEIDQDEEDEEEEDNDIDRIGEDTECQNLYRMIEEDDRKRRGNGVSVGLDDEELDEDTLEDACWLQDCVILLLYLEPDLEKEVFFKYLIQVFF